MIYFGSNCQINNCNICYEYLHEVDEYYCNYCGSNSIEDKKCEYCQEVEEIYFDCVYCDEKPNAIEAGDICNEFIHNINIIKKWYKNMKRNKTLWKIAEYYMKKKYNPQNEYMQKFINEF